MAVGLVAACSSPSDSSTKSSSAAGTGAATSGGSAGSGKPIKVGVVLPTSGPLAAASGDYQVVVKNLAGKIPNTSTIDGRPVQIVLRDDAGTAAGTASAMRQLLDQDKVDFILGPLYTAEAQAALPLSNTAKVMQIVFTGCPTCGDATKYPYAFSLESDRPSQMPSTTAAMKAAGVKKVAILESDDPSGQAYVDALTAQAKNALDLGTQASQLKSSGADAVYIASAVPADVANAAKAMKEISFEPPVFGNVAASLPAVVTNAGPEWIKKWAASGYGVNVTRPGTNAKALAFRDMMKTVEGVSTLPSSVDTTITAYDAFMMAKTAIEATHSTDGATLSKWLEQNGYAGGKGTFKFTSTAHNGMTADIQALIVPGTQVDGFPLKYGASS
jgi:branched-chain amino acid transport system substrate-binding protein